MKKIFAVQETTYVNEWLGMLEENRITALFFRENKKLITIKSYKTYPEGHVKKLYLPFRLRGKKVTAVGPVDHVIYSLACFLFLPLILLHDVVLFVVPTFFTAPIIPILKIFRKKVYVISLDPQDVLYETYKKKKSVPLWLYWKLSSFLEKLAMRSATKIFAVSNYLKEQYAKYNKNIYVTPNGADCGAIENTEKKRMFSEFTITYFGSIDSWRGVDMLIEAFKKIKSKTRRKIKLLLLGGGIEEDYMRKLASGNKDIYISGYISHDEAIAYCKGSDLLVAPFRETPILRKTFSIKPFEYIACAVPVIITDTGDHARLVEELQAGLVTRPNVESIAAAIERLMKDKKLYSRFKKNCERNKWKVDYKVTRKQFAEAFH